MPEPYISPQRASHLSWELLGLAHSPEGAISPPLGQYPTVQGTAALPGLSRSPGGSHFADSGDQPCADNSFPSSGSCCKMRSDHWRLFMGLAHPCTRSLGLALGTQAAPAAIRPRWPSPVWQQVSPGRSVLRCSASGKQRATAPSQAAQLSQLPKGTCCNIVLVWWFF